MTLPWHGLAEHLFPGYSVRALSLHFDVDSPPTVRAECNLDNGEIVEISRVLKRDGWNALDGLDPDEE